MESIQVNLQYRSQFKSKLDDELIGTSLAQLDHGAIENRTTFSPIEEYQQLIYSADQLPTDTAHELVSWRLRVAQEDV